MKLCWEYVGVSWASEASWKLIPSRIWPPGGLQLRGKKLCGTSLKGTWRPKNARIRWGLGFSEHQARNWAMLGVSGLKLSYRSLLEANPL